MDTGLVDFQASWEMRKMTGPIYVITEQKEGKFKRVSFEILSTARALADAMGRTVCAVLIGSGVEGSAEELFPYGADTVHIIDNDALKEYTPDGYAKALTAFFDKEKKPYLILSGATSQGKDFTPGLAVKMRTNIAVDCTDIQIVDNDLEFTRPVYAGKAISTVKFTGENIRFATIRPNVMPIAETDNSRKGDIKKADISLPQNAIRTVVKDIIKHAVARVELTEARVIVSGGRGMGGPENYAILERLADVLGGAVGASRAVVDAGWRDHQEQVGQTGKTVTPDIYIACGISGAIQHLAGMSSSKYIVAVNTDKDANIFKIADYGIVGDALEIVPLLTEEFKKTLSEN